VQGIPNTIRNFVHFFCMCKQSADIPKNQLITRSILCGQGVASDLGRPCPYMVWRGFYADRESQATLVGPVPTWCGGYFMRIRLRRTDNPVFRTGSRKRPWSALSLHSKVKGDGPRACSCSFACVGTRLRRPEADWWSRVQGRTRVPRYINRLQELDTPCSSVQFPKLREFR
jgi:hypothetical protein